MSNTIETLELTIEQAKKAITLREQFDKLRKRKEFKAIFEEELFENYATNLVYLYSDSQANDEMREDILKDIEMIGRLRQFLQSIYSKGNAAEKSIADSEQAIDEIRAEGGDE